MDHRRPPESENGCATDLEFTMIHLSFHLKKDIYICLYRYEKSSIMLSYGFIQGFLYMSFRSGVLVYLHSLSVVVMLLGHILLPSRKGPSRRGL